MTHSHHGRNRPWVWFILGGIVGAVAMCLVAPCLTVQVRTDKSYETEDIWEAAVRQQLAERDGIYFIGYVPTGEWDYLADLSDEFFDRFGGDSRIRRISQAKRDYFGFYSPVDKDTGEEGAMIMIGESYRHGDDEVSLNVTVQSGDSSYGGMRAFVRQNNRWIPKPDS